MWMDSASAIEIELIPPSPLINQSVTFNVVGITGVIRTFAWYNGTTARVQNVILSYALRNDPPQTPGNQYFSRATGFSNGSLLITNLIPSDQGIYTVEVQTQNAPQRASARLVITDYVGMPVIKASRGYFMKNEKVTLICDTVNADRILWGRGKGGLPRSATLSRGNISVVFSKVQSSDGGEYWCEAENPVSKSRSDIYVLTVTCDCNSCTTVLAGAVCGTILITILTVGAAFLLYKKYGIPIRQGSVKNKEEVAVPRSEMPVPQTSYYNMQADEIAPDQAPTGESSYMDLEHKSHNTYEVLHE
uniref:Ig-like domain-containing protein n=1 Tax=Leptobrachium leishanense TaxID=445787 RepID=A0A8C5WFM6_9ANUR